MANKVEIKIQFSKRLRDLIVLMSDEDSYVAYELEWMMDGKNYINILDIKNIDIAKSSYHFDIIIGSRKHQIKISEFLQTYYPDMWNKDEINEFIEHYTHTKSGKVKEYSKEESYERVEHTAFKYQPKDVRSTFLSLVTMTYPMGHEPEVLEFLPTLDMDKFGNYFKVIDGDDTTMFTSHLDTADRKQVPTTLFRKVDKNDEYIFTDGNTILGADDKAGVAVMLYMMAHNIPGIYYFFIGEERGGIGSRDLSSEYNSFEFLKNINKCISFDRRKTNSIITSQYGRVCCSDVFGNALAKEYNKNGMDLSIDPTGVFTDSASLMDDISECTNISVGYNNEHTGEEIQNITYLEKLAKASIKVEWSKLPISRKVGLNEEIFNKHKALILDIKEYPFILDVKVLGFEDKVFVKIDLDMEGVRSIFDELSVVQSIFYKHRQDPYVYFEDTYVKIQLK